MPAINLHFQYPWAFLILPLAYWILYRLPDRSGRLRSNTHHNQSALSFRFRWGRVPLHLRFLTILLLTVVTAMPQKKRGESTEFQEGLDIMLVIDTSGSMAALDFEWDGERRDRLTVIKKVVGEFVPKRVHDRMGLVVFGSQAFTQAPLTLDHDLLGKFLGQIQIGMAGKATAIGDALATATKRLADLQAKSKVIVLLTDGSNTGGQIDPMQAARAAQALGIKIYTIGVGQNEPVPFPVQSIFGETLQYQKVEMDETLLRNIAQETGGTAFLASDTDTLRRIYDEIDRLEKTKVESKKYHDYDDLMIWFAAAALLVMMMELLWSCSRWQKIP